MTGRQEGATAEKAVPSPPPAIGSKGCIEDLGGDAAMLLGGKGTRRPALSTFRRRHSGMPRRQAGAACVNLAACARSGEPMPYPRREAIPVIRKMGELKPGAESLPP